MALVKCNECGNEISQKAKNCPKCGAPIKQKTSLFTWIVAVFMGLWFIGYILNLSNQPASRTPSTSTSSAQTSRSSPDQGTIKTYKLKDTAHIGYTSYAVWDAFYRDQLSDNPRLNQPPDAAYLFIDLTVRNDDKKARSIAPFKLLDESGSEYETSSKSWVVGGGIGILDSLNPGVEKRGYIVFDVPRGKHYKLKISGGYWSSDTAFVDLGL